MAVTRTGACPLVGVTLRAAVGGCAGGVGGGGAVVVMVARALLVRAEVLVAVTVMVKVPAVG